MGVEKGPFRTLFLLACLIGLPNCGDPNGANVNLGDDATEEVTGEPDVPTYDADAEGDVRIDADRPDDVGEPRDGSADGADMDTDILGEIGDPCSDDVECESGECIDLTAGDTSGICSEICATDTDCPEAFDCVLIVSSGTDAERTCVPLDYCADEDGDRFGVGPGCLGVDCNDEDEAVNLAADEVCDGIDNDCDLTTDENSIDVGGDCTTGFQGECTAGRVGCIEGGLQCVALASPVDERCDGRDNDCDGSVDEGVLEAGYREVGGVCIPVECGPAPDPPSDATLASVSSTRLGGIVAYACNEGFAVTGASALDGRVTRRCGVTGEWEAPEGACLAIDCGATPAPAVNARFVAVDRTTFGGTATFRCNDGYSASDGTGPDYQIVCGTGGSWSIGATCDPVSCGPLADPVNGSVLTPGGVEYTATATYRCNSGYVLSAELGARTCQADGTWSGSAGVCEPVDCGALSDPPNGSVNVDAGTRFGSSAAYACNPGYALTGVATRTCTASAAWSDSAPTCASTSCGPLTSVENASVSVPSATTGSTATFSCNPGFTQREGTANTQTCDGTSWNWTGAPLLCDPVDCGALANPVNGTVSTPSGTTFASIATYTCDAGYVLDAGSPSRICALDGQWSGEPATCVPVNCGTPPTVANGTRTFTATTFGSSASYLCGEGFELAGAETLACTAAGNWETPPTCNDINECASGTVCTATGNGCTNTSGSWQCTCTGDYIGPAITGGDATCTLPTRLGTSCTEDAQCGPEEWCPTDTALRYCSPRPVVAPDVAIPFQYVPAGAFLMGAPGSEIGSSTLGLESQIVATLSNNYFVARTEITQGQWKALTGGANPACFQSVSGAACSGTSTNDSGPVEQIDWYSALAFANALSEAEGLEACYTLVGCANPATGWYDGVHTDCTDASFVGPSCEGYRLPTEAEWERAARAGTTTATWIGNLATTRCPDSVLPPIAWFCGNSGGRTQSVASRLPNPWGLFDMLGNVREWVWDPFVFYLPGGTDPLGAASGTTRVRRGGYWGAFASSTRAASRDHGSPIEWNSFGGFRLARTLP